MRDLIESLKYDYPKLYFAILSGGGTLLCLIVFMTLPTTPFLTSIGINTAQQRVSALGSAIFWECRALVHTKAGETAPSKSVWGNLVGLEKDGRLLVSVPAGKNWKLEAVHVADTKIENLYGAAGLVNQFKYEDTLLEYYHGDQVVVWIRDVPFNVKLIEAGFAVPDPNPPTNIVDAAFASHYWFLFNGEKSAKPASPPVR